MAAKTYLKTTLVISVFFVVLAIASSIHAKIIYVDDDAAGANDGSSWNDAFNYLQDALAPAQSGDEICVAQGIYKPDQGGGQTPGDRTATFQLINGVTLKGGYAGAVSPDPNARDIQLYETILTGDLNGNDVAIADPDPLYMWREPSRADNSFHVMTASGTDSTAVLDGFTIMAGQANENQAIGAGMYSSYGNPTITNCTFRANWASSKGGGIYNDCSSPILFGCRFVENFAYWDGGGICNVNSSPIVVNCIFAGNFTDWDGGAVQNRDGSNALVINCIFSENHGCFGGGLINIRSHPLLFGCVFTGNTSRSQGGAVLNFRSNPTLVNCTLNGNESRSAGGILSDENSNVTLTNCILWENVDDYDVQEWAQILGGTLNVNYCCVEGWVGGLGGIGNHGQDPLFVVPGHWDDRETPYDPSDDVWTAGDYHLLSSSPCIDAGDNSSVPADTTDLDGDSDTTEPVPLDLDGNPRFVDDPYTPDTGNGIPPIVDMGAYEGPNQGFLLSTRAITISEASTVAFTVALAMDPAGTIEVTVAVESGDPDISVISGATLTFDSSNYLTPQSVTLTAAQDADNLNGSALIHISGPGFFDAEISAREDDDETITSVLFVDAKASSENNGSSWADAYPDLQNALSIAQANDNVEQILVAQGIYRPAEPNGKRNLSFLLINGLTIKGGYPGCNGRISDARDIKTYRTVLSGDLNGDDGYNFENNDDNSYHVVRAVGTDATAVLDGFIITGGNADGSTEDNRCGAGLHINQSSDLTLTNCTFRLNCAELAGGGLYSNSINLTVAGCTFLDNSAGTGGGMGLHGDQTTLINCIFSGNSAFDGGGIDCHCTEVSLTNCTLVANTASSEYFYRGGGICGDDDTVMMLTNCIFWGNSDIDGMSQQAQIDHDSFPQTHVNFCCVQGWTGDLGGTGNFGTDPCFANANNSDYHLLPGSSCIDTGDPNFIAEPNDTDLDGRPRVIGCRIDMGAYEYSPPIQAEVKIVPRTINLASKGNWITCYICLPEQYGVADIEPNSIFLEGQIQPEQFSVDEQQQVATARFAREDVLPILDLGDINLKITGQLTDTTYFEATDTIKVIDKSRANLPTSDFASVGPNANEGTCWDPNECPCQSYGDATCDGSVNLGDLVALKAAWGRNVPWTPPFCCADFNQDGVVNLADMVMIKWGWGCCCPPGSPTFNQSCP